MSHLACRKGDGQMHKFSSKCVNFYDKTKSAQSAEAVEYIDCFSAEG